MPSRIHKAKIEFRKFTDDEKLIESTIESLKYWLLHPMYENYEPQIDYLIEAGKFEYLFDAFYQDLPFGTAGKRGKVGVGPNRINAWTVAKTIQGYCNYLKTYRSAEISRGIVIGYDVRQFTDNGIYHPDKHNPIWGLSSRKLAEISATVCAINGIKVHFFEKISPTPLISFAIRKLNCIGGINITASHNPPEYNGVKVYNDYGSQFIAPDDEKLIKSIDNVDILDVKWGIFSEYIQNKKVVHIDNKIEEMYIEELTKLSKSKDRSARILFSSLHGTGKANVFRSLSRLGFDIHAEGESCIPSGEFETIPDNYPNPVLPIVFDRLQNYANEINADIILASDPDADRLGVSVKDRFGNWIVLNGNEMVTLVSSYLINKIKSEHDILVSIPVTKLIQKLKSYKTKIQDDFLPGFNHLAKVIQQNENNGRKDKLALAAEDTLGFLSGIYARDKDAAVGAIYISEYASILKSKDSNLIEELDHIYAEHGYFKSDLEQIKMDSNYEMWMIDEIMKQIRGTNGKCFTQLEIEKFVDHQLGINSVNETQFKSHNMLEIFLKPEGDFELIRIIIRPSGTEPKLKIYFEIGHKPIGNINLSEIKDKVDEEMKKLKEYVLESINELKN